MNNPFQLLVDPDQVYRQLSDIHGRRYGHAPSVIYSLDRGNIPLSHANRSRSSEASGDIEESLSLEVNGADTIKNY